MNPRSIVEAAVRAARAAESAVVLIRPATFCNVMNTAGNLIEWHPAGFRQCRPVFRSQDGTSWPIEICDRLYAVREDEFADLPRMSARSSTVNCEGVNDVA